MLHSSSWSGSQAHEIANAHVLRDGASTSRYSASSHLGLSMLDDASPGDGTVIIIDDDKSIRDALARLFRSVGLGVECFGSASEFQQRPLPTGASCLVLDLRLPGSSGFDLQEELAGRDIRIPIVFITGHGDVPASVRAMKAGAIDFLMKPLLNKDLLASVMAALDRDRKRRLETVRQADLRASYESLTSREREVMRRVTDGLMNKHVAHELGISEITVKVYRGSVMRKMGAKSLADLVRMAEQLGLRDARKSDR
jgi:FixJ family two-component response regulator